MGSRCRRDRVHGGGRGGPKFFQALAGGIQVGDGST